MHKLLQFAILLLFSSSIFAQSSLKNIMSLTPNGINVITKEGKVTGYCLLYKADKIKGESKTYTYRVKILDEKGNLVAQNSIIAGKYFYLIESAYNEKLLCLKFFDSKDNKVTLEFYNNDAEKVHSESYEAGMFEKMVMAAAISSNSNNNTSIHPVPNKGFLHYKMVKNKNMGYEVSFYPNDKLDAGWTTGSDVNSKIIESGALLQATEKVILNTVVKKKTLMTKKLDYWLIGLSLETGEEVFNIMLENSDYEESLMNGYYDHKNEELKIFGNYFAKGDNTIKDKSLGLSMTTLSLDGQIKEKKYVSWETDVAKFLPTNSDGRIDKEGYIFFHKFVQKPDGSIFAIGESYKTILNKSAIVDDFYFFELTSNFELKNVKVFNKFATRTELSGIAIGGPRIVALMVYQLGGFDFSYLKNMNNGETFSVFYQDYEFRKGEKNRTVLGVISNTEGEYVEDKIDITTEADFVKILPAQAGNVLFLEFFKETKSLNWRFEKLNY